MASPPVNPDDPVAVALHHARRAAAGGDPLPLLLLCTAGERAAVARLAGRPGETDPLALATFLRPLLVEGEEGSRSLPAFLVALRARKLRALGDASPVARAFTRSPPRRGSWLGRLLGRGAGLLDGAVSALPGVEGRAGGMVRANLLVAGRRGSGRSTLLRAVFGPLGPPVLGLGLEWHEHPAAPLRAALLDLGGEDPAAAAALDLLPGLPEAERPHLAWVVLDAAEAPGGSEAALLGRLAARGLPALLVRSRAWDGTARGGVDGVPSFPVVAAPRLDESGGRSEKAGLEALAVATVRALPEARRAAAAAANLVALGPKLEAAEASLAAHARAAAALAATPVPLAEVGLVFAVQAKMVVDLTVRMGTPAAELPTRAVAAALVGPAAAGIGGRVAARALAGLLKVAPGVGTLVGGAVSAALAYGLTQALGRAYLVFLRDRWAVLRRPPSLQEVLGFLQRVRGEEGPVRWRAWRGWRWPWRRRVGSGTEGAAEPPA